MPGASRCVCALLQHPQLLIHLDLPLPILHTRLSLVLGPLVAQHYRAVSQQDVAKLELQRGPEAGVGAQLSECAERQDVVGCG